MKNFPLFVLLGLLLAQSAAASDDGWVDWNSQTPEADAAPTKKKQPNSIETTPSFCSFGRHALLILDSE